MIGSVFIITNSTNGKIYIGSSFDVHHSIARHKRGPNNIRINFSPFRKLYQAFLADGLNNFMGIVDPVILWKGECTLNELIVQEVFYIKNYDACNPDVGYNSYLTESVSNF